MTMKKLEEAKKLLREIKELQYRIDTVNKALDDKSELQIGYSNLSIEGDEAREYLELHKTRIQQQLDEKQEEFDAL